jgi:hypothetical protein
MSNSEAQAPLFKFIDEVDGPPIEIENVLTDENLNAGGLVPVSAWMRTKSSANALRQAKKKEKAETLEGKKQLNLIAPVDEASRDALKVAAAALSDGRLSPDALRVLSGLGPSLFNEKAVNEVQEKLLIDDQVRVIGLKVMALRGWRRVFAMWLIS